MTLNKFVQKVGKCVFIDIVLLNFQMRQSKFQSKVKSYGFDKQYEGSNRGKDHSLEKKSPSEFYDKTIKLKLKNVRRTGLVLSLKVSKVHFQPSL